VFIYLPNSIRKKRLGNPKYKNYFFDVRLVCKRKGHIQGLDLANLTIATPGDIDIIIGSDQLSRFLWAKENC